MIFTVVGRIHVSIVRFDYTSVVGFWALGEVMRLCAVCCCVVYRAKKCHCFICYA